MAARGSTVTDETVRPWGRTFGQSYAHQRRRRRPPPGDKGHREEVFLKINGASGYLGRAVDPQGNVLDIGVTSTRDKHTAKRFFRQRLGGCRDGPRVMITDKLKSYGAAKREIRPGVEHRPHKGWNNRTENSHQPTRQKERQLRGFWVSGTRPTLAISL